MAPPSDTPATYTREEVRNHTSDDSLWCIIDSTVYDVTDFLDAHPGGESVLRQVAGRDATDDFYNLHRNEVLVKYSYLAIGTITGESPQVITREPGELSPVPYAEPVWLTEPFHSPFYNESHHRIRRAARDFTDRYLIPEAAECELTGRYISQELIDHMERVGLLRMRLGPGPHLYGRELLGGVVSGHEFDYFHMLVLAQEMARPMARGFQDGVLAGMTIGLTPILHFMRESPLKSKVCEEVFSGKAKMCLAITEAFAGSDVSNIRTTAEKTPDGKHFIVNGTKKWITNGTFCDYFVTAVRTGKSYTVLLIKRGEGLETKPIKTSYSLSAGTAYVTFDNVKVPVENIVGEENNGLRVIFSNFNHERWAMVCNVVAQCRVITEECLKWSNQRHLFGRRLIDQPVVRQKLAKMISLVESNQAWLETVTHQMCRMPYGEQVKHLAGTIGLLKMSATRAAQAVADNSVQIWGGRGLTQSGMGKNIEIFNRTYKFDAILGGAEDVVADLGVRQAVKKFPKAML